MSMVSDRKGDFPQRDCPACAEPARYMTSILDVKRDRLVRIFRCDPCKKEIWDE